MVGGLAVLILQQVAASYRLKRLLGDLGAQVSLATAIDAAFVGVFFSQTFISFIGGDAMRVWRIGTHRTTISIAARAVLLDRVVGFIGLVVVIVVGMPLMFRITSDTMTRAGIGAAVGAGLAFTIGFLFVSKLPETFRRWRIVRLLMDVASQTILILRRPGELAAIVGLSVFIQALNPLAIYVIARGLGVQVQLLDALVLVPPVLLLSMLPISFAGWGVREGAMTVALGLVGTSPEQSVATSVCFGIALIIIGLPGGVLWFIQRRHAQAPPVET